MVLARDIKKDLGKKHINLNSSNGEISKYEIKSNRIEKKSMGG